ncbi:MAG: tetratricopeptide repeat protein [Candidatus Omnitrophota bacterium]|nr:tetratricopeptide repeat protein [Candidatus Omnitrophota bacterium]
MKKTIIILIVLFGLTVNPAYSYWLWTPKSGKWVNPKNEPKPDPKGQFEHAKGFYSGKKYDQARKEFKKLLKSYPKSLEASEAQYYLGLIDEEQNRIYEAYLAYQKVIDTYPFSERIGEIIQREFKIAESFISGQKRKVLGIIPVENPAIEILGKIVENSTYGPFAPHAQYKLGLVLKGYLRYYEAEEAFGKVIKNYPGSEWAGAAEFQLASVQAALSRGSDYDQGAAEAAKDKFEAFVKEHPEAILSEEAKKNISQLKEKEAESNFNIARFYEKQKQDQSARLYYMGIINNQRESTWAVKSFERLRIMEKKK